MRLNQYQILAVLRCLMAGMRGRGPRTNRSAVRTRELLTRLPALRAQVEIDLDNEPDGSTTTATCSTTASWHGRSRGGTLQLAIRITSMCWRKSSRIGRILKIKEGTAPPPYQILNGLLRRLSQCWFWFGRSLRNRLSRPWQRLDDRYP